MILLPTSDVALGAKEVAAPDAKFFFCGEIIGKAKFVGAQNKKLNDSVNKGKHINIKIIYHIIET